MKPSQKLLVVALLALLCGGCAQAGNSPPAQIERPYIPTVHHIWVTTGQPPKGKTYKVLGKVSYTEPWSAEATDAGRMQDKLAALALERYPDEVDALIEEESQVSYDGKSITVSATAIQYGPKDEPNLQKYEQVVSPPA